jgi:hypothetical protein
MGYYFYRKNYEQVIAGSQYHYRLTRHDHVIVNDQFLTGGKPSSGKATSLLYRVPEKEFNIKYRMKPAIIRGQFDHDKEILFPRSKNGEHGYDVITPFYYYDRYILDNVNGAVVANGDVMKKENVERCALAINRGWYKKNNLGFQLVLRIED